MRRAPDPLLGLVALLPLGFVHERLRELVQGSMVLHMGLQFPLLLLAGGGAAGWMARRRVPVAAAWARFDRDGLLATVWLSGVAGLWMVPAALDAALLDPFMAAAKYGSWLAAGWCVALAWPGMAAALRLFLLGNLAWMTATVGLMYAETEQRLCVSYRFDEQAWTGAALCAMAMGLLGGLVVTALTSASRPPSPSSPARSCRPPSSTPPASRRPAPPR